MRSAVFLVLVVVSFTSILTACSPYDPDLGGTPFLCGAVEPKCPDNYACMDNGTGLQVCTTTSGNLVDASISGFQCADDSVLEGMRKNDTIATAYITPVATQRPDIAFAGLAICPEGDKDTYQIEVTIANSNLEVITTWESGMPVSVSLLNGSGATINNGTSNGEKSLRAYAANLPVGRYFAQAYASATTKNNYRISLKVSQ